MAYTKFNKVILVKYGGMMASHPYIRKKDMERMSLMRQAIEEQDPFDPWVHHIPYKQCNTKWKMSKDKKEIYAICPHKIKFVLDERK